MNRTRVQWLVIAMAALYAVIATCSLASARPPKVLGNGDASQGEKLHANDCVACHVRKAGGDGSAMYTRGDRRVKTPEQLKAQVAFCNTELNAGYFPEDEDHVAAYLNLRFYEFKE
jgi:mono/diheme cytochrome c family protein